MADDAIKAMLNRVAVEGIKKTETVPVVVTNPVVPGVVPGESAQGDVKKTEGVPVVTTPVVPTPPANTVPAFLLPQTPKEPVKQVPVNPVSPDQATLPGQTDAEKNFANLRKKSEALEKRLSDVFDDKGEVRPEFISKLGVVSPDVEKMKNEYNALADKLAGYDLQADPRWQAKYAKQETVAKSIIIKTAQEYGVEPAEMEKALRMGLKDRQKFLNEQMPDAVAFIAPHFATLDQIAIAKDQDIQNARETHKTIQQQHFTLRESNIAQAREALYTQTVREMDEAGLFLFRNDLGSEQLNAVAKGVQDSFKRSLTVNDPVEQARTMALGAAAPVLFEQMRQADAEITRLKNELALRSGAGPVLTPAGGSNNAPVDLSNLTPTELGRMAIWSGMKKS